MKIKQKIGVGILGIVTFSSLALMGVIGSHFTYLIGVLVAVLMILMVFAIALIEGYI